MPSDVYWRNDMPVAKIRWALLHVSAKAGTVTRNLAFMEYIRPLEIDSH